MALAAGIALVLLGGAALIVQSVRLRNEAQRIEAERAAIARQQAELNRLSAERGDKIAQLETGLKESQAQNERALAQLKELQERQKPSQDVAQQKRGSVLAFLTLLPGSLRSEGTLKALTVSPTTSAVKLTIVLLASDYPSYRITIKGPDNTVITKDHVRPSRGKTLPVQLSAGALLPGDYIVSVRGVTSAGAVEPVSEYGFTVNRN
jgi:hypothetical protein